LNKTILQSAVISSLFTLILVGCGGGGGGGSSSDGAAPPAVTPTVIAQDATYTFSGTAITSVTDEGVSTAATASITYGTNGDIEQIAITTPTTTVTWDESSGDIIDDTDVVVTATNASDANIGIFVNADDPLINWQYQTFGVWETDRGEPTGTFGAATVGTPTTGSAIPTTGNATFTGLTGGVYVDATGTNDYITASSLTADVDFNSRSIALSTANTTKVDSVTAVESPATNLNMAGTLNYAPGSNAFSGNVSATGMTGSSSGQFYGPNAEELGGVFSLSGPGVETYVGGYGAKQ
jgi:hypothetical protein